MLGRPREMLVLLSVLLFALFLSVLLVVSYFGCVDGTVVQIAPVPGHCSPFT